MSRPVLADRRDPWLGIEVRHLAALSAIASEGTFSEAALSLGYVQSAISGQVAMLERLTGICLVERSRGPGPQRLTEAGELLLAHSREILDELETARQRLATGDEEELVPLRIAVSPDLADRVAGPLLSAALATTSGLEAARVDTLSSKQIADALVRQDADVALTTLPLEHTEIATAEVTRQPLVLAVQAASPLARQELPPSLQELSRLPLVVWREGCDPSRLELELSAQGLVPNVIARTDGSDAAIALVANGLGATMLPRGSIGEDPRLAVLELDEPVPVRTTGLAWLRARSGSPRLRRFVDLACRLRERS